MLFVSQEKREMNKEIGRKIEFLILALFTIYSLGALNSTRIYQMNSWIPIFMGMTIAVNWIVFLTQKISLRAREAIYVSMVEICIVLYGCNAENITLLTIIFIATAVITGLFGDIELLHITDVALLILAVYYLVIYKDQMTSDNMMLYYVVLYISNVAVIEFIIHFWVKRINENTEKTEEIIAVLKEAERSKDDFLANVSHEIRTPINTICGMSEAALLAEDPKKIRESLRAIQSAGRNLTSVVGDILDFSELQSGQMELENEAYNIASTINDVINMSMALKNQKPIELIVDCDPNIPCSLYGDEKKIRRVIMNFISNALKFTNAGAVSLNVSSRRESYGVNLCVTVRDTGIGMKEENLEKLFTSFNQVDTKRNRQEGGIGLGLALSQIIIQKMGGIITVKSEYGKGTTIQFVVPQKIVDERPIIAVNDRRKINTAVYVNMENFPLAEIRDEYANVVMHTIEQLQVRCQICPNLASLKRRNQAEAFTHLFISLSEYREDMVFFDTLSETAKVVIILNQSDMEMVNNPNIIRLAKPFYILPIVSILNGDHESNEIVGRRYTKKFIAPEIHALVVDDNWMNLKVMEGLLERYQIRVSTAENGMEALKKIEHKEYDIVFMDHMMPEMDGVEVLHRIRNKGGVYFERIPIIAVTANAIAGCREMFLAEGFADFIEKPVEISVLDRVLCRNIPEEKIQYLEKKERKNMETEQNAEISKEAESFSIGDLEVQKGILYCGGKKAYLDVLRQYCRNGTAHREKIADLYQKEDWKNYTIEVHAVKSMMLSIGANALSEQAKQLEIAGKTGKIEFIHMHHEEMLNEYLRILTQIEQELGIKPIDLINETEAESEEKKEVLDIETLESYLSDLEAVMFEFDGDKMLAILTEMEQELPQNESLKMVLETARRKIEMSDYMSAVDCLTKWKEQIVQEGDGEF